MSVGPDWDAKGPAKAKVRQLDGAVLVDEQVLRLEVSVKHTPRVAEGDALQDLVGVALQARGIGGGEGRDEGERGTQERRAWKTGVSLQLHS